MSGIIDIDCSQNTVLCTVFCNKSKRPFVREVLTPAAALETWFLPFPLSSWVNWHFTYSFCVVQLTCEADTTQGGKQGHLCPRPWRH